MTTALTNCDIYAGDEVLSDHAVIIADGMITAVTQGKPKGVDTVINLEGRSVSPGFIDLQVNGGGDVLFNDDPTGDGLRAIAEGHRRLGTTDILPTIITGPIDLMHKAADAVKQLLGTEPGILGIHFEGPLLSEAKLGVHDRAYLQQPNDSLTDAFAALGDTGKTVVTLAPEVVPAGYISQLVGHGILVAAGHTNATGSQMENALTEGITLGTHVWNAMSPITSREPGAVGALLASRQAWCDFVADGHHVDFTTLGVSIRAASPRAFLVTDAMSPVGGSRGGYKLGDLEVSVRNGRCETPDGTIAGSALDLATAVRNLVQKVGIPKDEALRMATAYPAAFLGLSKLRGKVAAGYPAHLAIFDNEINVSSVFYAGSLQDVP